MRRCVADTGPSTRNACPQTDPRSAVLTTKAQLNAIPIKFVVAAEDLEPVHMLPADLLGLHSVTLALGKALSVTRPSLLAAVTLEDTDSAAPPDAHATTPITRAIALRPRTHHLLLRLLRQLHQPLPPHPRTTALELVLPQE